MLCDRLIAAIARVEQHHRSCWTVANKAVLFMRFRELKPVTKSHRVGTNRFSSSVQFNTT
jgi:hypothetical protein